MTVEESKSGVSDDGTSSSVSGGDGGNGKTSNDDAVSFETHRKLLGEKKSLQVKFQETNAKLAEFEADVEAKKVEEQTKRGEFDKVIADKDLRIAELQGNLTSNEEQTSRFIKTTAFLNSLDGKLEEQYWGHIPLKSIDVNESGEIVPESLTAAVSSFKESHPKLIVQKKTDIPNTKTGSSGGALSMADWQAIQDPAEQRRRFKEVDRS